MSLHGGNQPCVMGQLAMNGILDHEFIPVRKDPALIAQQCETGQQITNLQIDAGNGQPKTVDCCWPRCDNPVFINRLRHKAEIAASIAPLNQGRSSRGPGCTVRLGDSQQDVGVNENLYSPQPA